MFLSMDETAAVKQIHKLSLLVGDERIDMHHLALQDFLDPSHQLW
jgi:hypothetical protein